jgi:prepilin-type N-terminal cleavage/methylation domain-containing protein
MVIQSCKRGFCTMFGADSARAFTFVEVLIVVVILSIVALMAIPLVSSAGSVQIRSAASLIAADLEFAKNTAIGKGRTFSVVFDADAEIYAIKDEKGNAIEHPVKKGCDYVVSLGDEGLDRIDIFSVDFDGAAVIKFDYMGTPYNADSTPLSSGNIILNAGGATMTISVGPVTGLISITSGG